MTTNDKKGRSDENREAKPTDKQNQTERRQFLRDAAAAAAGAALLTAGAGKAMAQECPKKKLTLDEMKAFMRDISSAADVDMEKVDAQLAIVEQYMRPLVDEDGNIPDAYVNALLAQPTLGA
ncbi:MAG: twin-arginine translocation signal domain-containing protein [Gemmatimonadota bacterium]|nr:MAG: twin-arginine translocation signal domain-containing protein [Gemmatimonadota bacterium]